MNWWVLVAFIGGCFIGAFFGIFAAALCLAVKGEEYSESDFREDDHAL